MRNDVAMVGLGSVLFAGLAAGGLLFIAAPTTAAIVLAVLLAIATFGFIGTYRSARRERAQWVEAEGLNRTGDGAFDQEVTAEEVLAARRLRDDESAVLAMIAEDKEMATVCLLYTSPSPRDS